MCCGRCSVQGRVQTDTKLLKILRIIHHFFGGGVDTLNCVIGANDIVWTLLINRVQ